MRHLYLILLCLFATTAGAQQLSHSFRNTSLSEALIWIDNAQDTYKINFIFDELEDFTVTTSLWNSSVKDAVKQVVGFYPMRVIYEKNDIYVECTQKAETKVSGHVVDEKGQPLPFVTVSLLAQSDSAFITGGMTNENGDFVVPCQPQHLIVMMTCIGYQTVTRNAPVGKLGTIAMKPETYLVQGVTVKGEIPQYKMTSGGMTVEVQHSILHDVGTAEDLLSMMPMVKGNDGKFEVLAKGEPEIYINNKKVRNTSELKQLKSVDVKSVDIITAPGAKYNAEVDAVIRIKTLKPQGEGFSLMATSDTWKNNKWNNYEDLNLKYRVGGLEAFANVALDNGHYSNDQEIDQELHISKNLFDIHAELPVRSSWTQLQYSAGLNYDFNVDHSVGLSFSSQNILYNHFTTGMNQHYLKNGSFYGDVFLNTDIREKDKPVWELNTYYVGKVGQLGIDLNATVLRRESEDNNSQYETSQDFGDRTITTQTSEKRSMAAGKLVLTYPVWKGVLSGGSEVISTESHGNNFNKENIIPESDTEMDEKNIAGFAEYEMQLGLWHLNAGLRYEHVSTDYSSFGIWQSEPSRTYNDWFPNLAVAWRKGKWSAQLSYNKSITRPPYNMLTSMIVYDSRMLYEGGNPLLRPSIRQSIDFNMTYSWLNFMTGFTHEHDIFTHVGKVFDEEKEIGIFMPENFDHQNRVYATLVASPKFGFWQPSATLHYYQQMFDTEKYGAPKKLNKPEFSFDLKNWFVFGESTKALLHISYTGSNHWGFMYRGSNFMMNARLQKNFCKGQLTTTLYANDILRTSKTKVTTYYAIGKTAQDLYTFTQCVGLTLSYNFNVTRSKYRGTGAGNEEKSRL